MGAGLTLPLWERNEYGFGIPCRYAKAIGKYGITAGMSVPNNPGIRGIAWYGCIWAGGNKFPPYDTSRARAR